MKRGTRVGQAYVAIVADGSDLDRQVADEFDNVDFDKHGEKHGDDYKAGIRRSVKGVGDDLRRVLGDLDRAVANEEGIAARVRKNLAHVVDRDALDPIFQYAGREAGTKFGDGFDLHVRKRVIDAVESAMLDAARNGKEDDLLKSLLPENGNGVRVLGSRLTAAIDAASADVERSRTRFFEDAKKNIIAMNKDLAQEMEREAKATDERVAAARMAVQRRAIADMQDEIKRGIKEREQEEKASLQRIADVNLLVQKRAVANMNEEIKRGIKDREALLARESTVNLLRQQQVMSQWTSDLRQGSKDREKVERAELQRFRQVMDDMSKEIQKGLRDRETAEKAHTKAQEKLWRDREMRARVHAQVLADLQSGADLGQDGAMLTRMRQRDRDVVDRTSAMLGAGARNNALNLLGRSTGKVLGSVLALRRGAAGMFRTFQLGWVAADAGMNVFKSTLGGLRALMSSLIQTCMKFTKSLPLLVLAGATVAGAMSVLATTISGLSAAVVALLATITSGLTGALAAGGTALVAFAAAAGLVTMAFMSMTDAQKKALGETFKGVREMAVGLGQMMFKAMSESTNGFSTWSKGLQKSLATLIPLANRMGAVFGRAGEIIINSLSGPGFQKLARSLTLWLPGITIAMSKALANFIDGTSAMFAALMPSAQRFGGYLERITAQFSRWANSASGQNQIVDFVDRALNSLNSLRAFSNEVFGLLGDLLYGVSGQNAGNNLFDSMTASLDQFRERIAGGEMESWFARGEQIATAFGAMLREVSRMLSALVTEGSVNFVVTMFRTFADVIALTTPVLSTLLTAITPVVLAIGHFAQMLAELPAPIQAVIVGGPILLGILGMMAPAFMAVVGGATALVSALGAVAGAFMTGGASAGVTAASVAVASSRFLTLAKNVSGAGLVMGGLTLAMSDGTNSMKVFGGAAVAALGGFMVGGPIGAGIGATIALIAGLASSLMKASDEAKAMGQSLSVAIDGSGNFAKAFSEATREVENLYASNQKFANDSTWKNGWRFLSSGEFRESMGNMKFMGAEIDKARDALIEQANALGVNTDGWGALGYQMLRTKADIIEQAAALTKLGYELDNSGNKVISLRNSLIDLQGAAHLNLSKNTLQQMLMGMDNIDPARLNSINQQLERMTNAINTAPNMEAAQRAWRDYKAYVEGLGHELKNSGLSSYVPEMPKPVDVRQWGRDALAQTNLPKTSTTPKTPKIAEYVNPYKAWAESLMRDGDTALQQIRESVRKSAASINGVFREVLVSTSKDGVVSALSTFANDMRTAGKGAADAAQQALQSAASRLANASSAEEARKALAEVKKAQKDLEKVLKNQKRLDRASAILENQASISDATVQRLVSGNISTNATLAEIAAAREIMAGKIEEANRNLEAAIAAKDNFQAQIKGAIVSYGSIMGAQAKTLDGVEQALTSQDITQHLQQRLSDITTFRANLNKLLAMGLSEDAYRQLVEGGVEGAGAYAQAIVDGGVGAVSQVNGLIGQIGAEGEGLGGEAAGRLYQVGIDIAKGLLQGLRSQDKDLEDAAAALGRKIAQAIKKELGIKSPARVMIEDMDHVGDGLVIGLNNQSQKVENAASALARYIDPAAALRHSDLPGQENGYTPVSGNSGNPLINELHLHTPTEDPYAAASEFANEMAGRL